MHIIKYTLYICLITQSSSLSAKDLTQTLKTALRHEESDLKHIQKYQQKYCTNSYSTIYHYATCEETKASIGATRIKMNLAVAENKHNLIPLYQALIMTQEEMLHIYEMQKFRAYKKVRQPQARL